MANRLVSVDATTKRLPADVRARLAAELVDGSTELGAAAKGTYAPSRPSIRASAAGSFNPVAGVWTPDGVKALQRWHKALARARAGLAQAKLAVVGDSITFGQYASPAAFSAGSVAQLRKMIDRNVGVSAGTGVIWAWGTFAGTNWRNDDTRVAWGSTGVSEVTGWGPFKLSVLRYQLSGALTFTPDVECDAFRIYFLAETTAATFTTSVDGGAPVNRSTGGTQHVVTVLTVPAGSVGTHTLTITGPSTGSLYLVGVEAVHTGAGVMVTGCGAPGKKMSDYNAASNDGAGAWEFITQGIAPHLTIFEGGHNEYLGQNTIATHKTELTTAIQRAQSAGSDVMVMTLVPNGGIRTPTLLDVNQARYDVAVSLGVPVLDRDWLYGSYAADTTIYQDTTHPNTAGYSFIADMVARAIL